MGLSRFVATCEQPLLECIGWPMPPVPSRMANGWCSGKPLHSTKAFQTVKERHRESSCHRIRRCPTHEETRFLRENRFLAVRCLPNKPPRTAA